MVHAHLKNAEIYVKELGNLDLGFPVFRPETPIHIGDVGFFSKMDDQPFQRLFNVILNEKDPGNKLCGVPPGFVPFQEFERHRGVPRKRGYRPYTIVPQYYHPREFSSQSIRRVEASSKDTSVLPAGVEAGFTYTLCNKTSAILSLHSTATRAEIIDTEHWEHYINEHAHSWYEFAKLQGFGPTQIGPDGLVLITRTDKADSWQHTTFRSAKKGASITFGVSAGGVQVVDLYAKYASTQKLSPLSRQSMARKERPSHPKCPTFDLEPKSHDQTLFVQFSKIGIPRSYKEARHTLKNGKSRLLPKKKTDSSNAGAESHVRSASASQSSVSRFLSSFKSRSVAGQGPEEDHPHPSGVTTPSLARHGAWEQESPHPSVRSLRRWLGRF